MKPTLRQTYSRPEPRVQFAFKDSMIHIICNSHYVSHFAAFFIDTGAKISVVESCLWLETAVLEQLSGSSVIYWFWIEWGFCQPGFGPPPVKGERPPQPARPALSAEAEPDRDKRTAGSLSPKRKTEGRGDTWVRGLCLIDAMILPQVHLRKPCYDFSFL